MNTDFDVVCHELIFISVECFACKDEKGLMLEWLTKQT